MWKDPRIHFQRPQINCKTFYMDMYVCIYIWSITLSIYHILYLSILKLMGKTYFCRLLYGYGKYGLLCRYMDDYMDISHFCT